MVLEVVVPMKQRVALSQTESSNHAVDRFSPNGRLTQSAAQAGLVQISLPSHSTAESANRCLRVRLYQ
jgi:hypothetical protein